MASASICPGDCLIPGGAPADPLGMEEPVRSVLPERSATTGAAPSGRPQLLLVERDEAMALFLEKALSAYHEVETVSDGVTAAVAARRCPPDLVLIDLYLPGTDNLTLIRPVRADPRTAGIPIIVLAASTHRELLLRCLGAGASNFLLKPFNLAELLMCVRVELRLRDPLAASASLRF